MLIFPIRITFKVACQRAALISMRISKSAVLIREQCPFEA